MLGKVMKHEFIDTGRLLWPMNLALLGCGGLGMLVCSLLDYREVTDALILIAVFLLYGLSCFAIMITEMVYLSVRFYKSMFGSESYLTHALPVSNKVVFNGKLLTAAIWNFIAEILFFGSVFGIGFFLGRALIGEIRLEEVIDPAAVTVEQLTDIRIPQLFFWSMLVLLVGCFSGYLMIFTSMAIGQLFEKHKILGAVGTYVVLYLLEQVISTVTVTVLTVRAMGSYDGEVIMTGIYGPMMTISFVLMLIMSVALYVAGLYLCDKKLNIT
ncbi:MAG: hypothetical protein IJ567_04165 [Lachnospiraceae bacterium]|nr:hypothetical protein [Lachnospiraceae bacterium]